MNTSILQQGLDAGVQILKRPDGETIIKEIIDAVAADMLECVDEAILERPSEGKDGEGFVVTVDFSNM